MLQLETMSIQSQRIDCLTLRGSCLLVCPHKRLLFLSGKEVEPAARKARSAANTLGSRTARFQASGGGRIADPVNDMRSVLLGRRFFLCRVQKNKCTNFRS